jgi:hypothetical protein
MVGSTNFVRFVQSSAATGELRYAWIRINQLLAQGWEIASWAAETGSSFSHVTW